MPNQRAIMRLRCCRVCARSITRRWGLRMRDVFVELVSVSVNNDAFAPIGRGSSRSRTTGCFLRTRWGCRGRYSVHIAQEMAATNRTASQSMVTSGRDQPRTTGEHGSQWSKMPTRSMSSGHFVPEYACPDGMGRGDVNVP